MTETKISSTGGARIGWVNASWPFATLTATRDQLELNASVIGKYTFSPAQVISIEKYTTIPVLGWGIRIKHNVASYPSHIVFWCFGSPASLIARIGGTGFAPCGSPDSVSANRGIPARWQTLTAIVVLWNLLFMADMHLERGQHPTPGAFSFLAVLLMFVGSVAIWRVRWLQCLVLKVGRSPSEIKAWLYLLALVSGIMSVAMAVALMVAGTK